MRLSTSTCIHERVRWGNDLFYTLEDSLRACVKAGYQIIDMNFASYSRGDLPMTQPDWEDWVRKHKDIAHSLNIEWSQGHAHFFSWNGVEDREWHEELIRRSIIGAGILGVKWLVIHPGSVHDGIWYSYKKSLAENLESYKRYGELAAKHNVGIAIENMIEGKNKRRYASSTEELIELHDLLDDPLFGICWDTGHAHLNGVDQPASLREIGDRLKALHIDDNYGLDKFIRKEMKKVLHEIQDGTFAGKWIAENKNGRAHFNACRRIESEHQLESVGKELRKMYSWSEEDKYAE